MICGMKHDKHLRAELKHCNEIIFLIKYLLNHIYEILTIKMQIH